MRSRTRPFVFAILAVLGCGGDDAPGAIDGGIDGRADGGIDARGACLATVTGSAAGTFDCGYTEVAFDRAGGAGTLTVLPRFASGVDIRDLNASFTGRPTMRTYTLADFTTVDRWTVSSPGGPACRVEKSTTGTFGELTLIFTNVGAPFMGTTSDLYDHAQGMIQATFACVDSTTAVANFAF